MDPKDVQLQPVILNQDSSFVVITYWWGRGNINKNLQTPCPYEVEEALHKGKTLKVRKEGMTYDKMIDGWVDNMTSHKLNYLVAEYPMFAVKGNYQNAINYKPYFIEEALRACYPRSVLYIDGDMFIKQYPRIFDTPGLDFAGRGWNSDLNYEGQLSCYEPYVFETSGGTLFFGQTHFGKMLVKMWQDAMKRQHGKAEDRVLSLLFNNKTLLKDLNMIQMPVEYLWLSMLYEPVNAQKNRPRKIITHPYCLTSEEAAVELSDEMLKKMNNRIPNRYSYYVDNNINCNRKDTLYEYIFYKDKRTANQDSYYNKALAKYGKKVIRYNDKYGAYNSVAKHNKNMMRTVKRIDSDIVFVSSCPKFENEMADTHYVKTQSMVIPTILAYLSHSQSVIYIPARHSSRVGSSINAIMKRQRQGYQLIAKNINENDRFFKTDYMLKLDSKYPVYFSYENSVLYDLLLISENMRKVSTRFNSSSTFIGRIRCNWL
jgi:hypothetical protein